MAWLPCRAVVPIGACYAGTLWLGNAAYLYLSVSFIQMLKVTPNPATHRGLLPAAADSCFHNLLLCMTALVRLLQGIVWAALLPARELAAAAA